MYSKLGEQKNKEEGKLEDIKEEVEEVEEVESNKEEDKQEQEQADVDQQLWICEF
jgi:hypothetical protein